MFDFSCYEKLPEAFYLRPDVVQIAEELVGKYLFTNIDGVVTVGKIIETEAYDGRKDRASHAFQRRTPRTEIMYQSGGHVYIYLCYGIHHLFNVVTNVEGLADAVLIRALEPVFGKEEMRVRRGAKTKDLKLTSGPGALSQAMGIHIRYNTTCLQGELIWIAENKFAKDPVEIEKDVRVGVDYAGEDALLPWRFFEKRSKFVSVRKRNPRL